MTSVQNSEFKHGRNGRGVGQRWQTKPEFLENPFDSNIISQHFRGWTLPYAPVSNRQCLRHRLLVCPNSFDKRAPIISECYDPSCCRESAIEQPVRHYVVVALAMGEVAELLSMDEPRRRFAAMMSGLDIHYDLGEGHPLLGRRMPDLDLVTENRPLRVFSLLHAARPVLLNLGEPGAFDIPPWADRVRLVDAKYVGPWELPALGRVIAPTAVLVRPDGFVAWVGDLSQMGLAAALTTWFGPPA